jgi:hypothetical protein
MVLPSQMILNNKALKCKKSAIEFIQNLKNYLAKHLDAGIPLEPILSNK